MAEPATCPKCGDRLPAHAPAGICPKCLMQAGLSGERDAESRPTMGPTTALHGNFVPPEPEELAKLFPQLEILELLGKGGMGAVYKARQPALDRLVAVKILPPEVEADPPFAERFTREARALARLSHQNIVSVFDFGQSDGQWYFIMEYVDGANLRQLLKEGEMSPEKALAIIPQMCQALQFAHGEGVVHRDIKPENILVDKQGNVKIADFGLAKLLGEASANDALTGTHQVMGTPRYMAPEQMAGSLGVDHRADIYSLGVVFYEMLTGDVPRGHFDPPSKKAVVDGRLDDVVLRALAPEPERRFQQASEMKSSIEEISSHPSPPQAAGISTVLERQVQQAWTWIAGDFADTVTHHPRLPVVLMLTMSIVGSLMVFLPWSDVEIDNRATLRDVSDMLADSVARTIAGYEVWPGMATAASFACLALLVITTPPNGRLRLWRPLVMTGIAACALFDTLLFDVVLESRTNPVRFLALSDGEGELITQSFGTCRTFCPAFYGSLGLSAGLLLLSAAGIRHAMSGRGDSRRRSSRSTDPPLTSLRFTVPAVQDMGPRVVFHFQGLGYRPVDEQARTWVFRRGGRWSGLWAGDVRAIHTTLTVSAVPGEEGEMLVSCVWAVRTLGAWVGNRAIKALEEEGHQLKSLLTGDHHGRASSVRSATSSPGEEPNRARGCFVTSVNERPEDSSETTLAEVRAAVAKPALGLMAVGSLSILVQISLFFWLFWWWIEFHRFASPNLIGWMVLHLMVVALATTVWIIYGAISMLNLGSLRDAQASAIAALLPFPGILIGLPFGIWALAVLSRPEVRSRFQLQTLNQELWKKAGLSLLLVLTLLFFCALVISA